MDSYVWLAKEQMKRLRIFELDHPRNDRITNRLAFFGQRYEIHVSHAIIDSVAAIELPYFPY